MEFQFVSLLGVWAATSFGGALAGFASGMMFWLILVGIIGVIILLPSIALWIRRLRDAGLTNWAIAILVLIEALLSFRDSTTILTSLIIVIFFVITLLPSDALAVARANSSVITQFLFRSSPVVDTETEKQEPQGSFDSESAKSDNSENSVFNEDDDNQKE